MSKFRLTIDHSSSSYGIPVLLDDDGAAYGPLDTLPNDCPFVTVKGAYVVAQMLEDDPADAMARAFLRSAPADDLRAWLPYSFDPRSINA